MILISDPSDLIGKKVMHLGAPVGTVTQVKPNMANGRTYAHVQPQDRTHDERRIPLDELDLAREP